MEEKQLTPEQKRYVREIIDNKPTPWSAPPEVKKLSMGEGWICLGFINDETWVYYDYEGNITRIADTYDDKYDPPSYEQTIEFLRKCVLARRKNPNSWSVPGRTPSRFTSIAVDGTGASAYYYSDSITIEVDPEGNVTKVKGYPFWWQKKPLPSTGYYSGTTGGYVSYPGPLDIIDFNIMNRDIGDYGPGHD